MTNLKSGEDELGGCLSYVGLGKNWAAEHRYQGAIAFSFLSVHACSL